MEKIAKNIRITVVTLFNLLLLSSASFSAEWISMQSGTTEPLKGVWGSSVNDLFVVGSNGIILRYNGSVWSEEDVNNMDNLQGVWGSTGDKVFAVGDAGTILQYNGSTWTKTGGGTSENLNAVWGSSGSIVFTVGENGTILRCEDGKCSKESGFHTNFSFNGVWGSSANDVFAVGGNGNIFHFDGEGWDEMESGTDEILNGVWGSSANDVFAVGENGTILHYDGSDWTKMPVVKKDFFDVGGGSSKYVLAIGEDGKIFRYDGSSWSEMESGTIRILQGIWVSPTNDSIAVGANGTVLLNENIPPTASFTLDRSFGFIETNFVVDASGSFDTEDSTGVLQVRWDWENDGIWDTEFSTKKTASHQYTDNGTYTIVLEVVDTGNLSSIVSSDVTVGNNKTPTAQFTIDPSGGTTQTIFTMDATESFDPEDTADVLVIQWDWENDGIWDTAFSSGKTATHQFLTAGTYLVRLQVMDSGGLTDSTTEEVVVKAGGCAASMLLGKDDDRLDVLRKFRDQVLAGSQTGEKIITYYYAQDEFFIELIEKNPAMEDFAKKFLEKIIPVVEKFVE